MTIVADYFAPYSRANTFRARRFQLFRRLVEDTLDAKGSCRILDVGGTSEYWRTYGDELLSPRVDVTLLNLSADGNDPAFRHVAGNACDMSEYADGSFDIVHSNSVIEHVGQWPAMVAMAREVRRLAPVYFVQTPSFWFPIEPHFRTAFMQYLPDPIRISMFLGKARGFSGRAEDIGEATRLSQHAILLVARQMQFLFPDARIERERVLGLTKSYIAIRESRP